MDKAAKLRQRWGNKPPCGEPVFTKEYIQGSDTGDEVCVNCGHYDFEHKSKTPTSKEQK